MPSTRLAAQDDHIESNGTDHVSMDSPPDILAEEKELETRDLDYDRLAVTTSPSEWRFRRARLRSLGVLLPSFLHRASVSQPKKLHASAWLDGMRGIAASFVVVHHSTLVWFSWDIHQAWHGSFQETGWLVKLPILRLVVSGAPQVMIFFVISGYAISHHPLQLARQGRFADAGAALSSGVFRRHPRLFLPAAFVTLCCALMTQLVPGWFDDRGLPGTAWPTRVPPLASSLFEQLLHWGFVEAQSTNPIGQGLAQADDFKVYLNPYDLNLWTLPVEFSSSMVVFMFLTAFTRVPSRVRMAFALALAVYFQYYFLYWALVPFLSGMLLCDLHFEMDEIKARHSANDSPYSTTNTTPGLARLPLPIWARAHTMGLHHSAVSRTITQVVRSRVLRRVLSVSAFLAGLWLLSVPEVFLGGRSGWGHAAVSSWVSEPYHDHVPILLGAIGAIFVVDQTSFLQTLFTNPFAQYMGRISYALYLVHGPLLWSLGLKTAYFGLSITGMGGNVRYTVGILIGACLWWPVAIWAADLLARFVDEVCVRVLRRIYQGLVGRNTKVLTSQQSV